ncbi:MAG: hypothetical protein RLZZ557_1146 [Bacteroidota bacterium]|jgi:leucyl/phenylalanyl-tRNA--protein transferase
MPVYLLDDDENWFPSPEEYEGDLVAVGGQLTGKRVLKAYAVGIFPWYDDPVMPEWYCPEERCVFYPHDFLPSKSLQQAARKQQWTVTTDRCFGEVITQCASNGREGNTWILPETVACFTMLHQLGYAHSVEIWNGDELVGGLYGLSIGNIFCGESMFSKESNASKFAFWQLAKLTAEWGYALIDAQVENPHLMSLGASLMPRGQYLHLLETGINQQGLKGRWITS